MLITRGSKALRTFPELCGCCVKHDDVMLFEVMPGDICTGRVLNADGTTGPTLIWFNKTAYNNLVQSIADW
jgi:hypothetical protein